MLFKSDSAVFDDVVIEDEVSLNWVESQERSTLL